VRDKIPPEVFKKPYANPVGGNPAAVRAYLPFTPMMYAAPTPHWARS
jgi:hypothetical protein